MEIYYVLVAIWRSYHCKFRDISSLSLLDDFTIISTGPTSSSLLSLGTLNFLGCGVRSWFLYASLVKFSLQ